MATVLQFWGVISGIAVILGGVIIWMIDFRDDYRELRRIVCRESDANIALSGAIIKLAEGDDIYTQIVVEANKLSIEAAKTRRSTFCLDQK